MSHALQRSFICFVGTLPYLALRQPFFLTLCLSLIVRLQGSAEYAPPSLDNCQAELILYPNTRSLYDLNHHSLYCVSFVSRGSFLMCHISSWMLSLLCFSFTKVLLIILFSALSKIVISIALKCITWLYISFYSRKLGIALFFLPPILPSLTEERQPTGK